MQTTTAWPVNPYREKIVEIFYKYNFCLYQVRPGKKWFTLDIRKASWEFQPSRVRKLVGSTKEEKGIYYWLSNVGAHPSRMAVEAMSRKQTKSIKKRKKWSEIVVYSGPLYDKTYANLTMRSILTFSYKLAVQILNPVKRRKTAEGITTLGSDKNLVVEMTELYLSTQKLLSKLGKRYVSSNQL